MNDRISFHSLVQRTPPIVHQRPNHKQADSAVRPGSFHELLRANLRSDPIKFSHHAETRLAERGIRMNAEQLAKLEDAVKQAEAKGAKESLILTSKAAFIVNVKNRTVVTAIDHASLHDHVFTQIDSAVIIRD